MTNADELLKPARRNYPLRRTLVYGIDDLWQANLVEMDTGNTKIISKINKEIKYLLTVIDVLQAHKCSASHNYSAGQK